MKLACSMMALVLLACGDDGTGGAGAGAGGAGASGSGASGSGASGTGAGGAGASGTGAGGTGAGGTGAGGTGAGGTGAAGTGGAPIDLSECDTDADCPTLSCVELVAGYRVCQAEIVPATACGSKFDQCCDSSECDAGQLCLEAPLVPFCGGIQIQPHNECGAAQCATDADCAGGVCAPPGTFGNQVAACLVNECEPGCSCGTVREPCCNQVTGLFCIVDCQSTSDCGEGESCQAGACVVGNFPCPA